MIYLLARSYSLKLPHILRKATADAAVNTKNTLPSPFEPCWSACCSGKNTAP